MLFVLLIEDPWDEYYEKKFAGVFSSIEKAEEGYKAFMLKHPELDRGYTIEEKTIDTLEEDI